MIARRLSAVVCVLASVLSASAQILKLDGKRMSAADAEAFAAKTLAASHVTGAQIVVINNGKPSWSYAYGLRRKSPDLPMDTQTTTWAASITKSVFATYVMQLVERGEFDLDKPIAQQLSKPLNQYEAYKDSASAIVNDPQWLTTTPRMLLSHSSGLANFAYLEPDKKMHLHFKPGTQFRYSGEGLNLVQFCIEQQKGKPLDVLMQDAIFDPLKMERTGLIYQERFAADVADRFDLNEAFVSQTKRASPRGAGSMTTSADDLARLASAFMAGQVISPATQAKMLAPQIVIRTVHQFPQPTDRPPSREAQRVGLAYGLGWGLLTHTRFGPAFFKEGHGDGAENYMVCFTRRKDCMILLTNSDNGELTFRALLETIFGDTVTPWEWESYTPAAIAVSRANP